MRTSSTSNMKFCFSIFRGHLCSLRDLNPDSGSVSTDPIESGSNPDPGLKHWWLLIGNAFFYGESLHISFSLLSLQKPYDTGTRQTEMLIIWLHLTTSKEILSHFYFTILSSLYFSATVRFYVWSHMLLVLWNVNLSWHSKLLPHTGRHCQSFVSLKSVWLSFA